MHGEQLLHELHEVGVSAGLESGEELAEPPLERGELESEHELVHHLGVVGDALGRDPGFLPGVLGGLVRGWERSGDSDHEVGEGPEPDDGVWELDEVDQVPLCEVRAARHFVGVDEVAVGHAVVEVVIDNAGDLFLLLLPLGGLATHKAEGLGVGEADMVAIGVDALRHMSL